ncbi:hypothetical protein [Alicyclobacillus dauci]|uniref:Uncharacterized protein n=1 Tax=Alicyclobacillus dauci TaxID=1475485 RepID=A0ABY6Z6Y4_9BACL|nr:hypothetical protein [Alicyclobacillus dauci]WAH38663.1 hypothetical protein NZD86_09355 [Alicyclobacillus dauci]
MKMVFSDPSYPVISVDISVDTDSRIIHILDQSEDTRAFCKLFNELFQARILKHISETGVPESWTWLYYNLDGIVTEYRNGFMNVPFSLYKLDETFVPVINKRLQKTHGVII